MTVNDYLKQAKERYPLGTKYKSPYPSKYADKTKIAKVTGELKVFGTPGINSGIGQLWITDGYGGSVYCNGQWAKIESESTQKKQSIEVLTLF